MSIDFPAELSEWDEGTTFMAHLDETIHTTRPGVPQDLTISQIPIGVLREVHRSCGLLVGLSSTNKKKALKWDMP